jgi:putative intracellular protease/amidase
VTRWHLLGLTAVLLVTATALALPPLLRAAGLHPDNTGSLVKVPGKRALIITTSHGVLNAPGQTTGRATGVFASEMTVPYYDFVAAGLAVDLASIQGGEIPIDPQSFYYMIRTPEDQRFLNDSDFKAKVQNSLKIDDVDFSQYDLIFMAGGWGAAYDLGTSQVLGQKLSQAYASPRKPIIGSVCHGALGLIQAKNAEGQLLIAGRRMTAVTNKQLHELGIDATPQHPETELRKARALYQSNTAFRDIFANGVVTDDEQRFVTGQNQNSGHLTAHTMLGLLANAPK